MTLAPQTRALLLDALRPPERFELDCAVGTTFSLDLRALLLPPVAFAMFDHERAGDPTAIDPIAVLEAVRHNAERIAVFCHTGRISLSPYQPSLAYVEDMIVQVRPTQSGRSFHPKLWVLRFAGPSGVTSHRLIVLSRNLTLERSWDIVVVLEESGAGGRTTRTQDVGVPLSDFLRGLVALGNQVEDRGRLELAESLAESVAGASFDLPEGFTEGRFHHLGITQAYWWGFPESARRCVIVSPFLTQSTLRRLDQHVTSTSTLISRADQLQRAVPVQADPSPGPVPQGGLVHVTDLRTLRCELELETTAVEEASGGDASSGTLSGLHGKLYLFDGHTHGRIFVGSANATHAAFHGNVEVLLELVGRFPEVSVGTLLEGAPEAPAFGTLTEPWVRSDTTDPADDDASVEHAMEVLTAGSFILDISADPTTDDRYAATLHHAGTVAADHAVTVRMLSLGAGSDLPLNTGGMTQLPALTLANISPFLVLTVHPTRATVGKAQPVSRVIRAEMSTQPLDRRERLLAHILSDPDKVRRYIAYLLALGVGDPSTAISALEALVVTPGGPAHVPSEASRTFPLYEGLLEALVKDPRSLDRIHRLVTDLDEAGATDRLPEGWAEIWPSIWQAREQMQS